MTRDRVYEVQGIFGPRIRLGEPAPAGGYPSLARRLAASWSISGCCAALRIATPSARLGDMPDRDAIAEAAQDMIAAMTAAADRAQEAITATAKLTAAQHAVPKAEGG